MVYFLLPDSVASGEGEGRPRSRRVGGPRMVTEDQFLDYCHLDLQKAEDQSLYESIKTEANEGLQRLRARTMGSRAQTSPEPLDLAQASEVHIQEEIMYMVENARSATSQIYALLPGDEGDNWIIRWLLFDAARRLEGGQ